MLEAIGAETERDDWIEEFLDPEIEWHDTPTYPSADVYVGREAFGRHAAEYEDAWADWGIAIEDIRAAGDRVVARIRYRGVGKQSGAPITGGLETPATGAVFELRGGRILRVVQFVSYEEALEAVGLSESSMSRESTTPDLVELTRRIFRAFSGVDVDAILGFYAPDAVLEPTGIGTSLEGDAAIRRFYEDWFRAYEEFEVKPVQVLHLGNGVVFDVWLQHARPVDSSGHVKMRGAAVSVWTDEVITRRTLYTDIDEARAAAERLAEERG
jgi:ketosteroid isomerase-like protein